MSQKINQNKFVSMTYTITDDSGEILERIDLPIQHIQGTENEIIPKIEQLLEGCQKGDEISVKLNPSEGFGEHQPELMFTDELSNVPPEFHQIGSEVEFQNDHGEVKIFRVVGIDGNKLTIDGNHPFAGKTITYSIIVREVREATLEELQNGVSKMPTLN